MSTHAPTSGYATPSVSPKKRGHLLPFVSGFFKAHILLLSVILALVVIYALVGFFLLPYLARKAAQEYVANELGHQLAIGELTFNPFTLHSTARDVSLKEPDGNQIVGFRELLVNAEVASLWQRGVVLKEVRPLIMTAADKDHTSYGCGSKSELTFFGRAVFDEQLRKTLSFEEAFNAAVPVIRQREIDAKKEDGFSNPQISVGSNIRLVLDELTKQSLEPMTRLAD